MHSKENLKDTFFSPKSEFNQRFMSHLIEKNNNNNPAKSEVELLDRLVLTISKEKDLIYEYYEKYPYKLSHLISIVHFTVFIFCQNKNGTNSNELNKIFARLFITLMVYNYFNLLEKANHNREYTYIP